MSGQAYLGKELINRGENMGVLDKFLNVMRLNPDDDDDFYNEDYDYDDDYVEEEPVKTKSSFRKEKKDD